MVVPIRRGWVTEVRLRVLDDIVCDGVCDLVGGLHDTGQGKAGPDGLTEGGSVLVVRVRGVRNREIAAKDGGLDEGDDLVRVNENTERKVGVAYVIEELGADGPGLDNRDLNVEMGQAAGGHGLAQALHGKLGGAIGVVEGLAP
ncbi:hypothetical protein BC936DRAFT_144649, partial [Jimgerdemannia flammicorona]